MSQLEPKTPEYVFWNNIREVNQDAASTIMAPDALKKILKAVAGVFIIKNTGDILSHIRDFFAIASNKSKAAWRYLTGEKIDLNNYSEVISRIEKRLHEELIGQDEAIDKIIKIMTGYFESVAESKALGKKFEGGLTLYLTGEPGTGKSTMMKIISEEMNLGTCTMRMSDAVEDKGNNASTVAARLLKPVITDNGKVKIAEETPLSFQIARGVPTLYCFDEIDKMRVLDSILQKRGLRNESGKIIGGSIDEMIRNFGDTGQINGKDVSGSILIVTSNETPEQMKELESSLRSRYNGCNIQFKSFDKNDFIKMIELSSKNIKNYYLKKCGIEVSWDAQALDYYAENLASKGDGARSINTLNTYVRYMLKKYINKNEHQSKKAIIKQNNETNQLYISEA